MKRQEECQSLAAIIRGLYLTATKKSWIVCRDSGEDPDPPVVPREALVVDIAPAEKFLWAAQSAESGEEQKVSSFRFDEEAAKILHEAFTAWEFERAPSGVEAATRTARVRNFPSCIAVKKGGSGETLYWIDRDIDAVGKRMKGRDGTLLEVTSGPWAPKEQDSSPELDASGRSNVVKDRIALVTGGAQGFGEEIVRGLAASGALVFIADLNGDGAEKLSKRINASEKRIAAVPVPVNVSDEASVEALFRTIRETAGGLDLCISNAGVLRAGSVMEQGVDDFKFVTDINYTGYFIIVKHAARLFRQQSLTAPAWMTDIIQINSKSGLEGSNKNGAYAGGKFGGIGLTASFALELIACNIKVNAICPGNFLDGPLWSDPEKGLFVQYLKAGKVPGAKTVADVKAFYEAKVPMKRGCTGTDVMRAIYYIVEQEYETGQALPVTGGQVMVH
ncbi:MAG: SDR family NAD(P)-dependent oxidoreductase [Treponema sp.]|jgi:sorbitol-6-phosphate 2-dehydrogenase|nr:SDR family NAD(P)-dependent oxidoreductase [Treponema sp.]